MTLAVNGRFLRNARPTGMHHVARSLVAAARARGLATEVLVPPGVVDPVADTTVWGPPGRFGDHAWEQASLPVATRGRPLLSLLNTAPVAKHRAAVTVYDLAFRFEPRWFTRSIRIYGAVVMRAALHARVVLTISDAVAGELAAAGVDRRRISVVRVALDPDLGPAGADRVAGVRARFGLERPYVLVVGWANPRKDVRTVIEAHRTIAAGAPHDLVLVGSDSPTFRTVDVPPVDTVRLLGYVDGEDLAALLTGAAAFLYPTLYEGFGIPPLEALACGTPAIVSDLPVLREATRGEAEFVPPGDVAAWAERIEAALAGSLRAGQPPAWTWDDAAGVLIEALAPIL